MTGHPLLSHERTTAAKQRVVERRSPNAAGWVHSVCQQLADATGWTIRFEPAADCESDDASAAAPGTSPSPQELSSPADTDMPHDALDRRRYILEVLQESLRTPVRQDRQTAGKRERPCRDATDGTDSSQYDGDGQTASNTAAPRNTSRVRPTPQIVLPEHVIEELLRRQRSDGTSPDRSGAGSAHPWDSTPPVCTIPIKNNGHTLGRILVSEPHEPTNAVQRHSVMALVAIVARLVSQNLGLERVLQTRTWELSELLDLARQTPAGEQIPTVLQRLLRGLLQLTGFRAAGLFVLSPDFDALRLVECSTCDGQQFPAPNRRIAPDTPDARALRDGMSIQRDDEADVDAHTWLPRGIRTAACQRIDSSVGPLGTLWVCDRRRRYVSSHDLRILRTFASLIGQTLERSVLQDESRHQQRFRREVAEIVGESPRHNRVLRRRLAGLAIAIRTEGHFELSGDVCEFVKLHRRAAAVAIGDACGDSLPAAVIATALRASLHTCWSNDRLTDPADVSSVVTCVNNAARQVSQPHQFASLCYAVIDTEKRRLVYCNAGHPPPLLIRDGQVTRLHAHGVVIGVVSDARYASGLAAFQPGDLLVLYTDGITEAQNAEGDIFGLPRLEEIVRQHRHETPQQIVAAVWRAMTRFTGKTDADDDRTLAVVKFPRS
ncbi:MAG: hypothetical protein D6725_08450 [Planctomycetota bacterium]|nr:MAG: hypothetical protein D6725_08450 [Planctomycetota bacterium]